MTPDIADKLAKCLRLLTSPHDGEVLAAASRINALVVAHDIDWSNTLANGAGGPVLTEEQMSAIYQAAYTRGLADGQQQAGVGPQPAPNASSHVGSDLARIERILAAARVAEERGILGSLGRVDLADFTQSLRDRIQSWGPRTYVSEKQRAVIDRLEERLRRQDLID
jgi:hypothetical protein